MFLAEAISDFFLDLKDDRFIANLVALAESDVNLKIRNAAMKILKTTYSVVI